MLQSSTPWTLFLDDERSPAAVAKTYLFNVRTARSTEEAKQLVLKHGVPIVMSLDHDLGGDDTAFKFLWWLIDEHLSGRLNLANVNRVQVHSANPIGVEKLMSLWQNIAREENLPAEIKRVTAYEA